MTIRTIEERRAAAVARKRAALAALRPVLAREAASLGGRYLLIGSAARGEMRHDSDVDLLLDFPDDAATTRAWRFAEEACRGLGLMPDIRPLAMTAARFRDHVLPVAASLP